MGKNYFTENSMSSRIDFLASSEWGARSAVTITKQAIIGCLNIKRGIAAARPIRYTSILPRKRPSFSALRNSFFFSSGNSSSVIHELYDGSDNHASQDGETLWQELMRFQLYHLPFSASLSTVPMLARHNLI